MYTHKSLLPQSEYVKYRGKTGQIDVTSSIITILSKKPGLRGVDIANLIYDKTYMPRSFGYVYEVLHRMTNSENPVLARSGNYYYLLTDALSHDMAVTANIVKDLDKSGVDLTQARYLSSGLLMYAEKVKSEANGHAYNMSKTSAVNLAHKPEELTEDEPEELLSEIETGICMDLENEELQTIDKNPFEELTSKDRDSLKLKVAEDFKNKESETERQRQESLISDTVNSIKTAHSLLGKSVEINPGKNDGTIVGTILELRSTGVTFIVTYSSVEGVEVGTVLPYEYSSGVTYKVVVDLN